MSMALGERELFPKVRTAAAEGKVVIADGFSCRTQKQGGKGQGFTAEGLLMSALSTASTQSIKQAA